jgi:murein DD-endopeptidase MepM/ murein hydrolase activator NlpD
VRAGQVDLAAARARLEIRRAEVGAFARAAYETGPTGTIASWLAATSPGDVIDRQQALASVAARLHAQLLALAAARTDLVQQQGALEQRRAAVAAQAARLSAAEAQARSAAQAAVSATATVQGLVARRAFAVHQAQDALAGDQQRYEQLQASSQRIATLLAARQAAARKGAGTPGPGASGLLWPADGPMTSPYGMRVDPVTHRRTLHAGIDIGAADGSEIRAAQAGTVAFAGDETGYGNYTCIDHGGGFATCYAHQSAILVAVGQQVARGQVIGRVGSTGYSTGPHLHFETRVNGNPVDPMQYF